MTLALAFLSNFQGTMVFLSLIQGDYFCMVSNKDTNKFSESKLPEIAKTTSKINLTK
jgi:hypothetical protein